MTNHKFSLLHLKLNKAQRNRLKRCRWKKIPMHESEREINKKKKKLYPPLSLGVMVSLSVLTPLSLKISHFLLPAHNKHTSFSHTKIAIIIKWKMCFWGLDFYSNRKNEMRKIERIWWIRLSLTLMKTKLKTLNWRSR